MCEQNFVGGHPAEFAGKAEFGEGPNDPFGGVKLPRFNAVSVIVLELVVVVMVALAESEQGKEEGVTGAAARGVGAASDVVAEGVDAEGAVLEEHDASNAPDEECAEC